jgi:hypothetical protein
MTGIKNIAGKKKYARLTVGQAHQANQRARDNGKPYM